MTEQSRQSREQPAAQLSHDTSTLGGWVLIALSLTLIPLCILFGFQQRFWILPPAEKLNMAWANDVQLLKTTRHGALFNRIQDVKLRGTDHSPVQEWIPRLKAPVQLNKTGGIQLDVFFIHQIEGNRYGVIAQYALIDLKTGNMVDEFARTLWLGIYY